MEFIIAGAVTTRISDKVQRPSLIKFHDLPFLVDLGISGISTSDSAVGLAAGSTKEDWSCGVSVIS